MGRATARAPMDKPAALNAPLFQQLIEQLDARGRSVILDLGAASTSMLSLLGRSRCLVEIADLGCDDAIDRLNAEVQPDARVTLAESLLPRHKAGADVDFVFCWDLLNYLRPEAITALMRAIIARARPGTRAHALIAYSDKTMTDRPGRFVPTEDLKLVNHSTPAPEIAAPRYSPEFLRRIMRGMEIEHARLLANGMQEFQFRVKR
jgi:hypothetical protein